jgi:AGZA family xanthine/uracil permease-like MFS transporter
MTCVTSDAYTCDDLGGIMTSGTAWLGLLGLMIIAIMMAYKNNAAFVVGIGLITAISWFRNTAVTYFPDTDEGDARFDYFKQVVSIESLDKVLTPYTSELGEVGVALITFLYVDFLDTSGTLLALASSMGYVDENGDFPKSKWAFAADALATMFGSLFGLSPVTSYIESGSGVEAGARTGLAAVICGFFFFLSIFFAPIIASIPAWATGGALIVVGAMMCRSLAKVKWYIPSHALSAFMTLMIMPLTYSIAYGLIAGIVSYMIMEGTFYLLTFVGIAKPEFLPADGEAVAPATEDEDGKKIDSDSKEISKEDPETTMRNEDEPKAIPDVEQMEEESA